ncbi:MAG: riboflavin synthase [Geminicoccaceae bacterium]
MFTGIVTHQGRLDRVEQRENGLALVVASTLDLDDIAIGASVCHNGICLTVTEKSHGTHAVFASAETLARTTMGSWKVGDTVNLERSLRLGDELGGHLVFGHVDGIGSIAGMEPVGESRRIRIEIPPELAGLVAVKGSITVDGISLTVNEVIGNAVSLTIIPHTLAETNLRTRETGDRVNLEADMLARYVARQLEIARQTDPARTETDNEGND